MQARVWLAVSTPVELSWGDLTWQRAAATNRTWRIVGRFAAFDIRVFEIETTEVLEIHGAALLATPLHGIREAVRFIESPAASVLSWLLWIDHTQVDRKGQGMPVSALSDEELLARYRRNYRVGDDVTANQVRYHLDLEIELTARLLASTVADRWVTFQECYDQLYRELPWLAETGGEHDADRWARLIGAAPQKVYEIGSGAGHLARALALRGYEVEATDISAFRGDREEIPGLSWSVTDGVHLDRFAEAAPYNTVISDQVTEHLHPSDIGAHLTSVREILKPGGRYILRTPHAFTGPHDLSIVFGYEEPVGMHLHEFTARELARQLRAAGFSRVESVVYAPQRLGGSAQAVMASRTHLVYLVVLERLINGLPRRIRRSLSMSLPGPFEPRAFLVATS